MFTGNEGFSMDPTCDYENTRFRAGCRGGSGKTRDKMKEEPEVFVKYVAWGKVFMYINPSFNILYPIVDLIKILPENTSIINTYGKGQSLIRTYGTQYGYRVMTNNLKTPNDYTDTIVRSNVQFVITFSDTDDHVLTNLFRYANGYKICMICYSHVDRKYHFYYYNNGTKHSTAYTDPQSVVSRMIETVEQEQVQKYRDMFPDIDLVDSPTNTKVPVLSECVEILKKQEERMKKKAEKDQVKILTNPILYKMRADQKERASKIEKYDDDLDDLSKKMKNVKILQRPKSTK